MSRPNTKEKINQFRENCEPITKAKDYAMKRLIETGKKMGKFRYLMLAVLFVFLFVYHFTFHLFMQFHVREKLARGLAGALSVILVFTSIDFTVLAAAGISTATTEKQIISSIDELPEDVRNQVVMQGDTLEDIEFPETLNVSILSEETEEVTTTEETTTTEESTTEEEITSTETTEASEETPESTTPESSTSEPASPEVTPEETVTPEVTVPETGTPETPAVEEVIPENIEEPEPEEPVDAGEPQASVENTSHLLGRLVDIVFPAMEVHAVEQSPTSTEQQPSATEQAPGTEQLPDTQETELPVTWSIDTDRSSTREFSTEIIGESFVFVPELPEEYQLAEGVELPTITVLVEEAVPTAFEQSIEIDGVMITVKAEEGVFPAGSSLKAERITEESKLSEYADAADEAEGISSQDTGSDAESIIESVAENDDNNIDIPSVNTLDDLYAFDISIWNKKGKEIQPDTTKGQVTIAFSNPNPAAINISDLSVYHIDTDTKEAQALDTEVITPNERNTVEQVEAEVTHFSPFLVRAASDYIILFTGGGRIETGKWSLVSNGTYVTDKVDQELPTPTMSDSATTFEGWYADSNYQTKVTTPKNGGIYYAKWIRSATRVSGSTMKYIYGYSGIDAVGIKNGREIQTTYANRGYATYYLQNNANASGGGNLLSPGISGDVFASIGNGLYVAQVVSFEGAFVRYSYYLWNRGTSQVSNFNIGTAVDVQIADNDRANLELKSDQLGRYVSMKDGSVALRLYYSGSLVTPADTLWTGRYSQHRSNVFNNHPYEQSRIDSTLALSWKNISIPGNGVVVKSFLLGCGDANSLAPQNILSIDPAGDRVMSTFSLPDSQAYTIPPAPTKTGYLFLGWNTAENGSGKTYVTGDKLYLTSNLNLYSQWKQIENDAEISHIKDGEAWSGQQVALYQNGRQKYALAEEAGAVGTYQNTKVINGIYDIYVNGRKADQTLSVNATTVALHVKQTVTYQGIEVTVKVDDEIAEAPGIVTLRKGSTVIYTLSGNTGVYRETIQESEGSYDIFIDGVDTNTDISSFTPSQTIDFYTAKVIITDDAPWTDAKVELRDANGNLAAVLDAAETVDNTVTYSTIIQKNEGGLSIYVNNIDVHKNILVKSGQCEEKLTYYTASARIKGDLNTPFISMTNGVENYSFQGSNGDYTAKHVLLHQEAEQELEYAVTINNTIGDITDTISSGHKSIELQYWTVQFYNVNSDDASYLVRTLYVKDGTPVPVYAGNIKLSAFTFSHWSEAPWTMAAKGTSGNGGTAYNFSQPVNRNIKLYANYDTPTVTIGELIYTDANGKAGGNGQYYRMGNLTISGFEPGEDSIKFIYLTTTNTTGITLLQTQNLTLQNGSSSVAVDGNAVSFTPASEKVAIIFNKPVSMAAAQDYLRNQVVVQPILNTEHTMIVEVTDKNGKYIAANGVTSSAASNQGTVLTANSWRQQLTSGAYCVTDNLSITGENIGASGLTIASGAVVYLYIAKDKTLTVTGHDANGRNGGGAGICVPSNATLIILGEGYLEANGGKAASGGNGEAGGNAYASGSSKYYYGGYGGAGGYGGGGAGAGIGGTGGAGGAGTGNRPSGGTCYSGDSGNYSGYEGYGGNSGNPGTSGGTIYILDTVTVTAKGGTAGDKGGDSGNAGSGDYSSVKWDDKEYHTAGGGGGGAGGGAGYGASAIGGGGAGAGSGGSGGAGGIDYAKSTSCGSGVATNASCNSSGGYGGSGARSGTDGGRSSSSRDTGEYNGSWKNVGATGGVGGSAGNPTTASGGTINKASTATVVGQTVADSQNSKTLTYTISFETPNATATKVSTESYQYGKEYNLVLPKYDDSDENVVFLGWKIKSYAVSGKEGSPMTVPSARYQEGDKIILDPSTAGDIVLVAVTETVGGVRDDDNTGVTIPADGPNVTYYTYNVTLTVDGEVNNKGNIVIGDKIVAPSAEGTYTLTTTDHTTKDIYAGGVKCGETAGFGLVDLDHASDTTIEYETITVNVTGKQPGSVTLTGTNAPYLSDHGNDSEPYVFTTERLSTEDKGSFNILVDGEAVGQTVSYGSPVNVAYHTVTVQVQANGMDASAITTVELRDQAGQSLFLTKQEDGTFTDTRLENNTGYTIYVNGEATDKTTDFSKDQTIEVSYNRYTTVIRTLLDGTTKDMGTVRLGDTMLVRTGVGTYQLTTTDNALTAVSVDGKTVRNSFTPGVTEDINYYSISYALSGEGSAAETGSLPQDKAMYLSGTEAVLLGGDNLSNGGKTFAGWKTGSQTLKPGDSLTLTGTTTVQAVWSATDIAAGTISINDNLFTYNASPQTPKVTVTVGDKTLAAGTDYDLQYKNTNTCAGRNDAAGSDTNSINAGTVTVTAAGKNDYAGTIATTYVIEPKTITVQNLSAVDREYDGTTTVQLTTDRAFLQGIEAGDDVNLAADSTGSTYSPNARDDKYVIIGDAQLEGEAASNYALEPVEPITVSFTKKILTADMFTLPDAEYDSTEQQPVVTATDEAVVDGETVNLIDLSDYSLSYADNIHAGKAAVTITAGRMETDVDGNTSLSDDSNYTGSVTIPFTIAKAPLTVTAIGAQSVYGEDITDVTDNYQVNAADTIFTEEDRENLGIKAITTVKKGYEAKAYEGGVTIAYNTENTDYDVTTVSATYTVTPADSLKVEATGYTGVYDGKEHTIRVLPQPYRSDEEITVYYSESELTKDNIQSAVANGTASTTAPSYQNVGETTVYYYAVSDNYEGAAGSKQVSITKAPLTIMAKPHSITYGEDVTAITGSSLDSDVTITGLADRDMADTQITGSLSFISNDYLRYGDVGVYTLLPAGLASSNYEISYQPGTLTVVAKPVTFTWSANKTFTYLAAKQGIYATAQGTVNGDALSCITTDDMKTGTGNYTAKVTGLSGTKAANYTFAATEETASADWSIGKADNSFSLAPAIQGWTEGETANVPVAAAKYGTAADIQYTYAAKPETGTEPEYLTTVPETAGDYLMLVSIPGTDDYNSLTLDTPVEFTIAALPEAGDPVKENVYATPENQTITYGEDIGEVKVVYTNKEGTVLSPESLGLTGELTYTTDYQKGNGVSGSVGAYTILPTGRSSEQYNIVYKPGTLTVEPKEVSLTWSAAVLPYTGKSQSVTAVVNSDSLISGEVLQVATYEGNVQTEPGETYTATALTLTGTGADNYKLPVDSSWNWKITGTENAFIIQPQITGWTYGDSASTPVATAKFGAVDFFYKEKKEGILDWGIFNPTTAEVPTKAGEYVLIARVEAGKGYTALESSETTFTIAPAEVVITANDKTSVYGKELQSPLTYTMNTLKGKITEEDKAELNIGLSVTATATSTAGTYPITVNYRSNDNVLVTGIEGIYTITKAPVQVTTEDVKTEYDGKAHGITVTVVSEEGKTIPGAEIYYSSEPITSQNYGSCAATSPVYTEAGEETVYYYVTAPDYEAKAGSARVIITQKEVTVTAKNTKITYGQPAADGGSDYDGFIGGDTAENLMLTPSYSYTYSSNAGSSYSVGSPAGTYVITPAGLSAKNYSFTYISGTLTVEKKQLTEDMFIVAEDNYIYHKSEITPDVTGSDLIHKTTGEPVEAGASDSIELLTEADYDVDYTNHINAGENTATVTLTASADGNYTGTVTKHFTILPKEITIAANPASSVYNMPVSELTYQVTKGSVETGDDLGITAVTSVKKGYAAGIYQDAVSIQYDKSNTNYAVTVNTAAYTVTDAVLSVTATGYQGVYDGKAHDAQVTAKTGALLTFAKIYYSGERTVDATNYLEMATTCPSFTDAGTHTVYFYAVCDNYQPVSGNVSIVIEKAPLTVTAPDSELTYGDTPTEELKKLTVDQLTFKGFVGTDTEATAFRNINDAEYTTSYGQYMTVGDYDITVSGLEAENYTLQYVPGTLTVVPKQITFTWPQNTEFTYTGNEQGITAAVEGKARTEDDVRPGSYENDLTNRKTNSGTAAGDYTAVVTSLTGTAAKNYTFVSEEPTASKAWRIGKADNSFTIAPSITDWTEGTAANQPVAAAKYGKVVYTYSKTENGTYTEQIPDNGVAGSYYMKASVAESNNYTGLEQLVPFTIRESGSTSDTVIITITGKDRSMIYGEAFTPGNISLDDVIITGLTADQNLSDVAAGTLIMTTDYTQGSSTGSYLLLPAGLTATEGYELVYKPGTLTVNKKEAALTWSDDTFTYDGTKHSVTASVNSEDLYGSDSIQVTAYEYNEIAKVRNEAVDAGSYTAHAIGFSGNNWNNYVIAAGTASHSWSIAKAAVSPDDPQAGNSFVLQPSLNGWTYGETAATPVCQSRFGTPHYVYSKEIDGTYTATAPATAGTWYLKAIVDGTDNYDAIVSEPVSFVINQAKITLIADDISSPRGTELPQLTYQMSGAVKAGDNLGIQITTTATKSSKIGEYPITISHNNNANYDITVQNGTCFITAGTETMQVTAAGYSGTYDGEPHGITVTAKDSAGTVLEDAQIYYSETPLTDSTYGGGSLTSPTLTEAGTKTIYYYVASDSYAAVSGSKDIVIAKKTVTVTAKDTDIVYGEAPVHSGAVFSGFIKGDTETTLNLTPQFTCNYEQYQNAGKYCILPGGLPETGNYTYEYIRGTLTVSPKPATFVWTGTQFTYDGTVKRTIAEVSNTENGDILSVTYEEDAAADMLSETANTGTYVAKAVSLSGDRASSYVIKEDELTAAHSWNIASGTNYFMQNPSIDNWTYGENASMPQGKAAYGQMRYLYSDSPNGTYSQTQPVDAGTYYMKARVEGTADYDAIESAAVPFQINQAKISVIADDLSGKKGDEIKELTYTIMGSQVAGEKLEVALSTTATDQSDAGEYPITVTVNASDNYEVTAVNGTYHILTIDLDITAEGVNTPYDGSAHGIKVSASGDAAAAVYYSETRLDTTKDLESQTGSLKVSPTRRTVGTTTVYYYVTVDGKVMIESTKNIVITKKELTIKAKDWTINKGEVPANDGVTYDGFVTGDDETDLTGQVSFSYNYTKGQPAGQYQIIPSGFMASNYQITYVAGTLTVLPVQENVAITGVVKQDAEYDGKTHTGYMGAPSVAGGAVSEFIYTYEDASHHVFTEAPVNAGTYTLTISVPDTNRLYKGKVSISFTIAKKILYVRAQNQAIIEGQQFNPLTPTYSGFAEGDTQEAVILQAASATLDPNAGTLVAGMNPPTIQITAIGTLTAFGETNYSLSSSDGKLTVLPKDPQESGTGTSNPTGGSVKLEPDNTESGIIQTAVIKDEDQGLPRTELESNLTVAVAEKLLAEEEKDQIKAGDNALIYLELSETDENANAQAAELIKQKAAETDENMEVALFLDLSLYKQVGNNPPVKITETNQTEVTISIEVPETLRQTDDTVTRNYYIIYEHNGVSELIYPVYQDGVLTFKAKEFSVYSIAYKDTQKSTPGGNTPGGNTPGGNTPGSGSSGDNQEDENTSQTEEVKKTETIPQKEEPPKAENPKENQKPVKDNPKGDSAENTNDDLGEDKNTNSKGENTKEQEQTEKPQTLPMTVTEDIPKEKKEELEEAVKKLQEYDPSIQPGPYIKLPEELRETADESGKTRLTVEIPEELLEDGRTFYLVTVDSDGNVMVLSNDSMEDGIISVMGDPNAVYQIVYEDGGDTLTAMIGADGTLLAPDGSIVKVGHTCFWHWLILLITVIGALTILIAGKKKRKYKWLITGVVTIMSILLAVLGTCGLDWIFAACSIFIMFLLTGYSIKKKISSQTA